MYRNRKQLSDINFLLSSFISSFPNVSSVMHSIISGSKIINICIVHNGERNNDRFDSPLVLLHSLNYNTMQL